MILIKTLKIIILIISYILSPLFYLFLKLIKPVKIIRITPLLSNRYGHLVINPEIYFLEKNTNKKEESRRIIDLFYTVRYGVSNYEIAKADLEIRGPGTVFGYKQSGGLSRVGLDLYSQLVLESLSRLEAGEGFLSPSSVSISIGEELNIPEDYIFSLPIRTSVYKKIHKKTFKCPILRGTLFFNMEVIYLGHHLIIKLSSVPSALIAANPSLKASCRLSPS